MSKIQGTLKLYALGLAKERTKRWCRAWTGGFRPCCTMRRPGIRETARVQNNHQWEFSQGSATRGASFSTGVGNRVTPEPWEDEVPRVHSKTRYNKIQRGPSWNQRNQRCQNGRIALSRSRPKKKRIFNVQRPVHREKKTGKMKGVKERGGGLSRCFSHTVMRFTLRQRNA